MEHLNLLMHIIQQSMESYGDPVTKVGAPHHYRVTFLGPYCIHRWQA